MTIDFENKERKFIDIETCNYEPFIGYIAPNGDLIDYTKPFGESGHDGWDNIVSDKFLAYVSYIIKGTSIHNSEDKDSLMYPGIDEHVIRGMGLIPNENRKTLDELIQEIDRFLQYQPSNSPMHRLRHTLLLFFRNAYSNKTFFETINKKIYVTSEEDFIKNNIGTLKEGYPREKPYYDMCYSFDRHCDYKYIENLKLELMSYFKDIMVMYLGYDSVERFKPNGELIEIPYEDDYISYCRSEPDTYFYKIPRIISTSYNNINERFYNFLLMDWAIHKLPRYLWNEAEHRYEKEPDIRDFYQNDNEEIIGKEIKAIKRLVPKKERYKYFR